MGDKDALALDKLTDVMLQFAYRLPFDVIEVYIGVVPLNIGSIHTCNIFDITIIVLMSDSHVRITCRCITSSVVISRLSRVEARVTHVRANNEPSTRPKRV